VKPVGEDATRCRRRRDRDAESVDGKGYMAIWGGGIPLPSRLGGMEVGKRRKFPPPSGVWGGASAEIEFGEVLTPKFDYL